MSGQILLLRPEPGASESAGRARALGLTPILAPLFTVRPLAWIPPDPAGFHALLLTSANALRHGGAGLARYRHLPVHAVGEATAAAAREAGFAEVRIGHAGVEKLLRDVPSGARLLHLCGREHIRPERHGIHHLPVYASDAAEDLPPAAKAALSEGALVLLHSPRAARLFARLADEAGIPRNSVQIAALSEAVAQAAGTGWAGLDAAPAPDDGILLKLAARLLKVQDGGNGHD